MVCDSIYRLSPCFKLSPWLVCDAVTGFHHVALSGVSEVSRCSPMPSPIAMQSALIASMSNGKSYAVFGFGSSVVTGGWVSCGGSEDTGGVDSVAGGIVSTGFGGFVLSGVCWLTVGVWLSVGDSVFAGEDSPGVSLPAEKELLSLSTGVDVGGVWVEAVDSTPSDDGGSV